MASQLARDPPTTSSLYDEDIYLWARQQAQLLRERRFDELDLANLIEEVDDVAGSQRRAVLNNTRIVLQHLLKLQSSRDAQPRNGWRASVREHRNRLDTDLTKALRAELAREVPQAYGKARRAAAADLRDYGEADAAEALPTACPYTLEQILDDEFWPAA